MTMKFQALSFIFACGCSSARQGVDFDHLRSSVIRIQAVASDFDWFRPFVPGQDGVGVGSGFVVQVEPYPIFATNHHVVSDSNRVTMQLLQFGEQQWAAEVVSVCPKFDLALIVLRDPDAFTAALAEQSLKLKKLELSTEPAAMGQDVVALGFPLGQDSLKISKGNIAGNEDVNDNICIQSTAPISPGNSGGPLLNEDGSVVVGVNFAKATEGENINYVIPAFRVDQLVKKHLNEQPEKNGSWKRMHTHVPLPQLTTMEANEALYELSNGCKAGIYVGKISERSFFRNAKPAVPEQSFLVSVNGIALDKFGMGLNPAYVSDRVAFADLFYMVPDLSADMEFEVCSEGKTNKYTINMAWKPEYERGIRYVDEPNAEGISTKYEMFGELAVMEMTLNHISAVVSNGDPGPARWLHPDLIAKPRLLVSYVQSGGYASDVLAVGSAVAKVNGHEVFTLAEFAKHIVPDKGDFWTLETDMGKMLAMKFNESLEKQIDGPSYFLTPGVVEAAKTRFQRYDLATFGKNTATESDTPLSAVSLRASLKKRGVSTADASDDAGASSATARAAGPLMARRLSNNGGRTTRVSKDAVGFSGLSA